MACEEIVCLSQIVANIVCSSPTSAPKQINGRGELATLAQNSIALAQSSRAAPRPPEAGAITDRWPLIKRASAIRHVRFHAAEAALVHFVQSANSSGQPVELERDRAASEQVDFGGSQAKQKSDLSGVISTSYPLSDDLRRLGAGGDPSTTIGKIEK